MKNKKIIGLSIIGILFTSSIAFANDIKALTKDDVKYIPLKKVIQKSGGKVDMSDDTAKITIDGKNIVIEKNLSFAKLNNNYYPLNKKKMNGIEVPVDTKPIFEKDEVYIEKDFLKDNKIANYKIEKDNVKVILEDKDKPTPTQKVENVKEEKDSQVNHEINDNSNESNNISRPTVPEKPSRPSVLEKPSRPTKPNRPNTGGNNNNNSSNSGSNNNSGGSVDNSGSNNVENTDGENNSGSENNGNQTPGQSTPEIPNDQPSTATIE